MRVAPFLFKMLFGRFIYYAFEITQAEVTHMIILCFSRTFFSLIAKNTLLMEWELFNLVSERMGRGLE